MAILNRSRIEYLQWGVNWVNGCTSDCAYCYARQIARRFARGEDRGWVGCEQRFEDPAAALEAQLSKMRKLPEGMIMLSTSHDPAMTPKVAWQMARLVFVLDQFGLLKNTLLLTKHPTKAVNALWDAFYEHEYEHRLRLEDLRFGVSLTADRVLPYDYERGAEPMWHRFEALDPEQQYKTWVSLEPPLPEVRLTGLVELVLDLRQKPWVVLGKMNYRGGAFKELSEWSRSQHWGEDRDAAVELLRKAGYAESLTPMDGGYWVKRELREWQPK
jgi:DNA repair photolyase